VYSTCLICGRPLGHNDVLETLPVGRRIAFDPVQGRLWVICPSCARWNLVPFDTRLETIDACERLFSDARLRFSTDHIGIARLREGLELVRIGPAQRPELAAWRYGDRFASRRRRNIIIAGTLVAAGIGGMVGLHALVGSMVGVQFPLQHVPRLWESRRVATRVVPAGEGEPLTLTVADIKKSWLERLDDGPHAWAISVPNRVGVSGRWFLRGRADGSRQLVGQDAVHALGAMLPVIAGTAGSKTHIENAVTLLEQHGDLDTLVGKVRWDPVRRTGKRRPGTLGGIKVESRLAIEMLANEESERRWLEGELKLLERQWRDADRLAAIADQLSISDGVEADIEARRRDT
jgi:hypothetical protein